MTMAVISAYHNRCVQEMSYRAKIIRGSSVSNHREMLASLPRPIGMESLWSRIILGVVIVLIAWGVLAAFAWQAESTLPTATSTVGTTTNESGEGILPYDSGIRGVVMLGPTCPVVREPPDPDCADRPYATDVLLYRAGESAPLAFTKSDVQGRFEFAIPPGEYIVQGVGERPLPSCGETSMTVAPGVFTAVTLSCDTGIR